MASSKPPMCRGWAGMWSCNENKIMIDPKFFTNHWPLSDVSLGETLQSYPTRKVVRLHAQEGEFVAKIDLEPLPFETVMKTYTIFDFLASRHFSHIPTLLKTKDGDSLVYSAQQSVAVMEFIDGSAPESTPATWQSLGQVAASLNSITDYPFPYCVATEGVIEELTEDAHNQPAKAQFLAFVDLLLPLLDYPGQGLVHGEINLTNSMRRRNGELVLVDWDEAGTGATVLEAGYPLLTVFLTEDLVFQQELAAAFYRGTYGKNPPDASEIELIFRSALLHALRYMIFANQQKRWERICYAADHKDSLLEAIF
jgi:Ser/Thr protein kinase RdoA (MazF antagonist)